MQDNGPPDRAPQPSRLRCFVVSAFGSTPEDQRRHKQVLRHLVAKVLSDRYTVIRADQIDDEGLITNQIVEHLLEDELVIADLTGLNPNVFYELAVRHAARKPIVHLITRGQDIPFDVANMRAVPYALDDPDLLEEAQKDLARKVKSIEESNFTAALNPVSAARDVWLLRNSSEPQDRQTADLLAAFNQLQDEVRALARRTSQPAAELAVASRATAERITEALLLASPYGMPEEALVFSAAAAPSHVREILRRLADVNFARQLPDGQWVYDSSSTRPQSTSP